MDLNEVKNYLSQIKFNPSKKLGQNFLIDGNVINKIIYCLKLSNYKNIVEIGPGLASLTDEIVNHCSLNQNIYLVELDKRLAEFNAKRFKKKQNIIVINNDFLKEKFENIKANELNLLVSNLPYSISSMAILKFLKSDKFNNFVCMLQKEMIAHINAPINTKKYNSFTVLVQWYAKIINLFDVSRTCFYPQPNVDSGIIQIKKNQKKWNEEFSKFIHACFLKRRKTLMNNLKGYYQITQIKDSFKILKIHDLSRPQELSPKLFFDLYQTLNSNESIQ